MKAVIRNHDDGIKFVAQACRELGEQFQKPQLIEITVYRPPRTLAQNAKLHAMIGELADEIGYSAEELKMWFKVSHGPKDYVKIMGKEVLLPISVRNYNKAQMTDMIGHVERIGADMGFKFSDETQEQRGFRASHID